MTWQEPAPYVDGLGRLLSPGFDGTNGTTPHDGGGGLSGGPVVVVDSTRGGGGDGAVASYGQARG
jgi:hypothetical protein